MSSQWAIGTVAITTALTRSAHTITRLRFHRSDSAPANSPKSRYGIASQRGHERSEQRRAAQPVDQHRQRDRVISVPISDRIRDHQ